MKLRWPWVSRTRYELLLAEAVHYRQQRKALSDYGCEQDAEIKRLRDERLKAMNR